MACENLSFLVKELYSDGIESDISKIFSISLKEQNDILYKLGYGLYEEIFETGIIVVMFSKLYNFTIGVNGFVLNWDKNENGTLKKFESGSIYWRGPNPPACKIGGDWWRIYKTKQ